MSDKKIKKVSKKPPEEVVEEVAKLEEVEVEPVVELVAVVEEVVVVDIVDSTPMIRVVNRLPMNPYNIPLYDAEGKSAGTLILGKRGTVQGTSKPIPRVLLDSSPHLKQASIRGHVRIEE